MNLLIASRICEEALGKLKARHHVVCAYDAKESELKELAVDREAIIFRSGVNISRAVVESAPDLRLLVRAGSGLDNLALDAVEERGLELVRIPRPGARAVAELTFGLMLTLARQILPVDQSLRAGRWMKSKAKGSLLEGKTLGIVGAGSIGTCVGEMAVAWGMEAIGCTAHPTAAEAARLQTAGVRMAGFDEIVESADFLSIHVPLTGATRGLIGADVLRRMKPGAFLLNLSRGGVVDEAALAEALTLGQIAGAGLDVHEREGEGHISILAGFPNVVLTPHIGATTVDTQREIGRLIIEAVERSCKQSFRLPPGYSLAQPIAVG